MTTPTPEAEKLVLDLPHLRLHALAWGPEDGRLMLCLHGFPDSAHGWHKVAPTWAAAGFRVVAPFMRGYAPTGPAHDGSYHVAALMRDVLDLHLALGAPEDAVVVGHDWGAFVVNGLTADPDSPFSVHVTMAVPNFRLLADNRGPLLQRLPTMLRQARKSWYILFFQVPWLPERLLPRVIPRLWRDWGPTGRGPSEELDAALTALPTTHHRHAALGYYRALVRGSRPPDDYRDLHTYARGLPVHPVLHLQGLKDGAIDAAFASKVEGLLPQGSRVVCLAAAGHFLQLEEPEAVAAAILDHLTPAQNQ